MRAHHVSVEHGHGASSRLEQRHQRFGDREGGDDVHLEGLPADYRQVIVLRHVEGLPFLDVAKAMNRSVDSVEKLWVRGLAKLKTVMSES